MSETQNVTIEKLHHDHLWIIQGFTIRPTTVDAWEAAVRAYIQQVSPSTDRFLVYDLSRVENLRFTSYMRQRIIALAEDNRDATGRVGIVLEMNPVVRLLFEPFLRLTGSRIQPHLSVKLFDNREAAVQWVASLLPEGTV